MCFATSPGKSPVEIRSKDSRFTGSYLRLFTWLFIIVNTTSAQRSKQSRAQTLRVVLGSTLCQCRGAKRITQSTVSLKTQRFYNSRAKERSRKFFLSAKQRHRPFDYCVLPWPSPIKDGIFLQKAKHFIRQIIEIVCANNRRENRKDQLRHTKMAPQENFFIALVCRNTK